MTGGSEPSISVFQRDQIMKNVIWLVGAVVIILAVLGFFGLR